MPTHDHHLSIKWIMHLIFLYVSVEVCCLQYVIKILDELNKYIISFIHYLRMEWAGFRNSTSRALILHMVRSLLTHHRWVRQVSLYPWIYKIDLLGQSFFLNYVPLNPLTINNWYWQLTKTKSYCFVYPPSNINRRLISSRMQLVLWETDFIIVYP